MAKNPKLVRGRAAAPAQNDPADLAKMKTVLGVDMAKDPGFTVAQVFDGARMGLAPKVVLITDPPILTPFGFRKAVMDHFEKLAGEGYEQASARMWPVMAEITPKMRRLLRSGDRRKRKRGARLYWAAPGEHSRGRLQMEIAQGDFERSKILIRRGFARLADSAREFYSVMDRTKAAVDRMAEKIQEAGLRSANHEADALRRLAAGIAAQRAGKTAFVERELERMRRADPDTPIVIIEPRKEKE